MKTRKTFNGSPYRCQSGASYLAMEILSLVASATGGGAGSGGRWYVVEARLPYNGELSFKCKSKLAFRVHESQIAGKSLALQRTLLDSYMDLTCSRRPAPSDLRLQKALLPAICSVPDAYPEVFVAPRREISIRVTQVAGWDIPEAVVDKTYSTLTHAVNELGLALSRHEA